MTLPPPDEIRKMRGRDLLALGSAWFEQEGRRAIDHASAAAVAYGPDHVGPEMHVRASASFAFATLLDTVRVKAEADNARKEDGVFASLLASALRSGFLPRVPEATNPEATPDAA